VTQHYPSTAKLAFFTLACAFCGVLRTPRLPTLPRDDTGKHAYLPACCAATAGMCCQLWVATRCGVRPVSWLPLKHIFAAQTAWQHGGLGSGPAHLPLQVLLSGDVKQHAGEGVTARRPSLFKKWTYMVLTYLHRQQCRYLRQDGWIREHMTHVC